MRKKNYYKLESYYFFKFTGIQSLYAMIYTTENSILHNEAKYCKVNGISDVLSVEAVIDNKNLFFDIKWKDILFIAFDNEYSKSEVN